MDQGVSKRLRACNVGHSFVRRLGESLECEARRDGTDACVGVAAPGLLRVDDVYNEVWTLGRSGYTLHGIRSDIFSTGNLFPDVVILNCGSNDLCDRFVDIESIADGLVSYAHLLTVSFGVKVVYILGVVGRDRCRQVSAAVFRSRAWRLNRAVCVRIRQYDGIHFDVMRGFWRCPDGSSELHVSAWSRHGIHPNSSAGARKYRRNNRRVLLAAAAKCFRQ